MEVDSLRSSVQTEEAAVYCMLYLSLSKIKPVAPMRSPFGTKTKDEWRLHVVPNTASCLPRLETPPGPEHHQMVEPRHHLLLPSSGLVVHLGPI